MTNSTETPKTRLGIFPKLLIVLVLVSLLPLLVVWFLNYQTILKQVTFTALQRLDAVSDTLVARVNDWMDMNSRMLRENAAEPDIRSMDPERQKHILSVINVEYPWIPIRYWSSHRTATA